MKRAFLLVLLLAQVSLAEKVSGDVFFDTDPPGLRVWLFHLESADYLPRDENGKVHFEAVQSPAVIQFGYGDRPMEQKFNVDLMQATRDGRWPKDGSVKVKMDWPNRLRYEVFYRFFWPEVIGGGLLVLVLLDRLVLAPRRRQNRLLAERGRKFEQLQAQLGDDADPMLLAKIGKHRLTSRLGAGGMATVYRAEKDRPTGSNTPVAIKVIHRESAADEEFRARFKREVMVCSRLNHPNIVRTLDWGDQDGLLYLIMELVDGHSLCEEIRPGGLPPARVLSLVDPIMDALIYAHGQGVIHRDLKPDNVMLSKEGRPIIMDFGLARRSDFQTVTLTGTVLGTPAYLAPEQITGEPPDARCDQYSLGIMLFELLTGQTPFGEADPIQLIVRHMSEPPPMLRDIRPELSPQLERVVMAMLNKRAPDRYPDIKSVQAALRYAISESPPE